MLEMLERLEMLEMLVVLKNSKELIGIESIAPEVAQKANGSPPPPPKIKELEAPALLGRLKSKNPFCALNLY